MSDPDREPRDAPAPAVEAFAEYLERVDRGESVDLEQYCGAHPEIAQQLRQFHRRWREMSIAFADLEPSSSPRGEDRISEFLTKLEDVGSGATRYETGDEIGRGGMGRVLRVWDRQLHRALAMKVLRDDDAAHQVDSHRIGRLLEEAQITGQLEHPGVVPVHELGVDERGRVFFTMALIRGRSLAEIIELVHRGDDDWNTTRAIGVVQRVCEAVAFAHSRGVVHRDIKPSNIMVGAFGETYVMDWGLARVLDDGADTSVRSARRELTGEEADSPHLTSLGDVVGTPAYMAPEQARGHQNDLGPSVDVYAIGAVLYHLLAGSMPYRTESRSPSTRSVVEQVVEGPPVPLHSLARQAPAELVAICEKAMQRDPAVRYDDVTALSNDLRAFVELRVVRAYETGAVAELRKWVRRNRSLALASGAAVLMLVAGLIASLLLMQRADSQAELAQSNFRLAHEAVAALSDVGLTKLADVPGQDETRRELLDKVLEFHREFLVQNRGDVRMRADVARAHLHIGFVELTLGRLDAAEASFTEAHDLYVRLADSDGDEELRFEAARTLNGLALIAMSRGETEAAEAQFRRTIEWVRALDPEGALRSNRLVLIGDASSNLAHCLDRQDQHDAALALRRESIESRERLIEYDPDDLVHRAALASYRAAAVPTLRNLGRDSESEAEADAAVALLREVRDAAPSSRKYRAKYAQACGTRARMGEDAERFREALTEWQSLADDYPAAARFHAERGSCLTNLARLRIEDGDLTGVVEQLEVAAAALQTAVDLGADASQLYYQRTNHFWFCESLLRLGRYAEVSNRVEELVALPPQALEQWVWATEFLARCAQAATDDMSWAESERTEFAQRSVDRAVEILAGAVDHGFRSAAYLDRPTFDPLRSHSEFQALVRQLK